MISADKVKIFLNYSLPMIHVDEYESYAILTIDREEKANALNLETIEQIKKELEKLEKNKNIVSVIITGKGKFFSAGGDLREMLTLKENDGKTFSEKGQDLMNYIEKNDKIFIACLNGPAYGGGMELALACDIRVAGRNVKMGQTEINVGLVTGWGGAERLIENAGKGHAKFMLLTGYVMNAEEAKDFGIIHILSDNPLEDSIKIAKDLAKKNTEALIAYKRMVRENSYSTEREEFGKIVSSKNGKEAISAFLEKREPRFT